MPIPSNPPFLTNVLGYAADVSVIPSTTPSGSGAFSYQSAFPQITGIPLTAGGVAPAREDFNAAFKLLSQHVHFLQSGSLYTWDSSLDYLKGAHILGSNGVEYIAQATSGPNVPDVGAKDPTTDTDGIYWKAVSRAGGATVPAGAVMPFYNVNLGGTENRNPIFWGETEADEGWLICDGGSDGRGGTVPDLREKFVMGANGVDDAGQTGGAVSATPTVTVTGSSSQITVQGTTLNVNQMPSHTHTVPWSLHVFEPGGTDNAATTNTPQDAKVVTHPSGGSQAHTHGITDQTHTHTATASAVATLPPFYKLIFCVKLPAA